VAEQLKRSYNLIVLKVSLDTSSAVPTVRYDIEVKLGGALATLPMGECSTSEMGIPARIERRAALYRGYDFRVPSPIVERIRDWLRDESPPGIPLWLQLLRPAGYLEMVPWEELLQERLEVPMLRLPDFVVQPPRETPSVLDVLLCSSTPIAKDPFPLDQIVLLIERLGDAVVSRRTRFHLFADAEKHAGLRDRLKQKGLLDSKVVLYGPETAAHVTTAPRNLDVPMQASRLENPWLIWMRDALRGRSVDVGHFLCHGYLSGDHGALSFAESPLVNTDTRMARFVGSAELRLFLNQVGAWSAVFSSPHNNYSDMGLRELAHAIGQSRPGPSLHHESRLDSQAEALRAAYQLLYSGQPQKAPAYRSLAIHCQPFRVLLGDEPGTRSYAPPPSELNPVFESTENVPAWVAASERYLEQCEVEVQRLRPTAPQPQTTTADVVQEAQDRAATSLESTLQSIRAIVARAATRSGGGT
jgi:hypothetical protein